MHQTSHVPAIVMRLYELVAELETHFPDRPFTPDGHLIGSIGEVLAAHRYGLTLSKCSTPAHDATTSDGKNVQIKATQGSKVGIRAACDHLIVLYIRKDGTADEIFNGPGAAAWEAAGSLQKNGQRQISVARLRKLMTTISPDERLCVTS